MKSHRWLTISVALALAVVMLWAVPTLAQGQRQRPGWPGLGLRAGPGTGSGV